MKLKNNLKLILIFITFNIVSTQLINIKKVIPDINLDLRYATKNNFTKTQIYTIAECFLLEHIANALKNVNNELKSHGYKLKIFDGYRPISAQRKMFKVFPDPKYVSDPDVECGRHTRGTTVDVTLIKLDNSEVEMPTEFDCFKEEAHSDYQNLKPEVKERRELLKKIMQKHGFKTIKSEWWHFDYKDWKNYPPLDINFEDLMV